MRPIAFAHEEIRTWRLSTAPATGHPSSPGRSLIRTWRASSSPPPPDPSLRPLGGAASRAAGRARRPINGVPGGRSTTYRGAGGASPLFRRQASPSARLRAARARPSGRASTSTRPPQGCCTWCRARGSSPRRSPRRRSMSSDRATLAGERAHSPTSRQTRTTPRRGAVRLFTHIGAPRKFCKRKRLVAARIGERRARLAVGQRAPLEGRPAAARRHRLRVGPHGRSRVRARPVGAAPFARRRRAHRPGRRHLGLVAAVDAGRGQPPRPYLRLRRAVGRGAAAGAGARRGARPRQGARVRERVGQPPPLLDGSDVCEGNGSRLECGLRARRRAAEEAARRASQKKEEFSDIKGPPQKGGVPTGRRISVVQRLAAAGFASAVQREETAEEQSRKANARQFEQNCRGSAGATQAARRRRRDGAATAQARAAPPPRRRRAISARRARPAARAAGCRRRWPTAARTSASR